MGDYYINVPASSESYESPALFAADPTQEPASGGNGQVHVGNIYFHWDTAEGGFTNTGWWGSELNYGPTSEFLSDKAVIEYLQGGNNLDKYFQRWQEQINSSGADGRQEALNFYAELFAQAKSSGMSIDSCAYTFTT